MAHTVARVEAANLLAGEWRVSRSGRVYERPNPWRLDEVVGEFPSSDADDVAAAVDAANAARRDWRATPAAAILRFFSGEGWRAVGEVLEQSASGAMAYTRRRPQASWSW